MTCIGFGSVALHVATRLALIAFATVGLRGILNGADFQSTSHLALSVGAGVFAVGLVVGDLTRRLVEDMVLARVRRTIEEHSSRDDNQTAEPDAQFTA